MSNSRFAWLRGRNSGHPRPKLQPEYRHWKYQVFAHSQGQSVLKSVLK